MRLLFLGDIVGNSGKEAVIKYMDFLRQRTNADMVIVNAENASGGFGLNASTVSELLEIGVDAITLGNHAFGSRDIISVLESNDSVLRPINIAENSPGLGVQIFNIADDKRVMLINVLGRVFMNPAYSNPFKCVEEHINSALSDKLVDAVVIDFHCEATSEKVAMGHWCDGRASAVLGTHTHVPSADFRILPLGTAYQTDVGMCGDYNSIIGMDINTPLERFVNGMSFSRMKPATGEGTISGALVTVNDNTGLADSIFPVRIGGCMHTVLPSAEDLQ